MFFPPKSAITSSSLALGTLLGLTPEEAESGLIGPKGFNRLYKVPYKSAVKQAEELEQAGLSQQEIFDRTKLIRNKNLDNKWISAISDINAKYANDIPLQDLVGQSFYAQNIYNHPELYKAYPEFKQMPITLTNIGPSSGAYHSNKIFPFISRINITGPNKPQIENILVHEFNHAIQDAPIENWPIGGNVTDAKTKWTNYTGPAIAALFDKKENKKAFDLLKRWNGIQTGTDEDAYYGLGGEVLSRQSQRLLLNEKYWLNRPFSENVVDAVNTVTKGTPNKPSGYILPEYATNRRINLDQTPFALSPLNYETLAKAYYNSKSIQNQNYIKEFLNQHANNIQQYYNLSVDDFLKSNKLSTVPAVTAGGIAGNVGEAKPTTGIQQFFQTNPIGQFMTGIARSVPETVESMINEAQSMGSQFYGLPEQQSGTKFTNYLTEQGIIPPKTGSTWEDLGGLLGL